LFNVLSSRILTFVSYIRTNLFKTFFLLILVEYFIGVTSVKERFRVLLVEVVALRVLPVHVSVLFEGWRW
jgi:hypothetical protein